MKHAESVLGSDWMEERLNFSNTPLFNTILRKQAPIERLLFDKGLPNHCTYRESTEVSLGAKLKAHRGSILRSPRRQRPT